MLLPLDMLRAGEHGEIAELAGDPAWVGRLAELGLREGARLCVLQPGTPCLLQVANGRLCLRGSDSAQILVRPICGADG